jgi:protein phosphatase
VKCRVNGLSDIGMVREENQDAFLVREPEDSEPRGAKGALLVIADGMGGLEGGKVASELSIEAVERIYYSDPSPPDVALRNAAQAANRAVFEQASRLESGRLMGSTLTAASIVGARAWIAQVGDSRAYLCRGGEVRQITKDHSLVQDLVDRAGESGVPAGRWVFSRNIVTRGLGLAEEVEVDLYAVDLEEGDTLLLSSDGLHEVLEPAEIASCLERLGSDLEAVCREYIALARERGGPDNITVALARLEPDAAPQAPDAGVSAGAGGPPRRREGRFLPLAVFLAFAAGVVLTLVAHRPEEGARLREARNEVESLLEGLERLSPAELRERVERLRALIGEDGQPGKAEDG